MPKTLGLFRAAILDISAAFMEAASPFKRADKTDNENLFVLVRVTNTSNATDKINI